MGLFDFLFGRSKSKIAPQSTANQKAAAQPRPTAKPPAQDPIDQLRKQIEGVGHPEYPLLHREYSPGSRVPCADFTGFIMERLKAGDAESICTLMRSIIEANPGVGVGSEWISKRVMNVIDTDLDRYVSFDEPAAMLELKAMWIIAEKFGAERQYWLNGNTPLKVAQALCAYHIEITSAVEDLVKKGNSLIRRLRKDAPHWKEYPLFSAKALSLPELQPGECIRKVRALSIGARLHLFCALSSAGCDLPRLTDYPTRDFGLYIPDSSREILSSQLLIPTEDPQLLTGAMSKDDLISACEATGTPYKKSWNKAKLLNSLIDHAPGHIKNLMAGCRFVALNTEYSAELRALRSRSESLETLSTVLCFA